MSKIGKWLDFISILLISITPMLYLYNNNVKYLYLQQIIIVSLILMVVTAILFIIYKNVFHSEFVAFIGCFIFIFFIYAYNPVYNVLRNININIKSYNWLVIIIILLVSYIVAYVFHKLFYKKDFHKASFLIFFTVIIMLFMNINNFAMNYLSINHLNAEYKKDFYIDKKLPSPNIYYILCDGMLGFDAMKKYFNNSQEALTEDLTKRGFTINKGAMFESGHNTRIAIPVLMCPEYYDKYLADILQDNDKATDARLIITPELFEARFNNETINAFHAKGYTTVAMGIDEDMFFPTTDYFYYMTVYEENKGDLPSGFYVEKSERTESSYFKSRFCYRHLDRIFLAGISSSIFDFLFKNNVIKHPLTNTNEDISYFLPGKYSAERFSSLVNSMSDCIYSTNIKEPKFVLIHNFMAHSPFCFDKDGNINKSINKNNIWAYPEHYTYAVKTLIKLVDVILEDNPDVVIILQADHGLHQQIAEQITKAFNNPEAKIDIWNKVFCAVRIPEQYKNGDEYYAESNPLNITRYLVNSYCGGNYSYIADKNVK